MGSRTLTPPTDGAWLDLLALDPLVVVSPEAAALILLGLADRQRVVDLTRHDTRSTPVHGPADPASPPGSAGPNPTDVRTLVSSARSARPAP
jgi:hypothetical protein